MNPELFASTIDIDQSCGLSTLIDADHVYIFISAIVRHARPAPIVFATGLRLGVIAKDMQGGELGEARAPFAEAALHADMPYYFEIDLKLRRSRINGGTITLLLDFVQETQFWLHHLDPGAAVTRTVAYNASEIADMAPANAPCRDADDGAIIPRARHAQDAGCLALADLMWHQALRASRDAQDRLVCWINLIHIADLVTRVSALGAALPPMDAETAAPAYLPALVRGLADRRGPDIDRLDDADLARLIQLLGRRKHDAALRQIARHAWHRDISAAARAILAQIGAAARLDDRTHVWLWGEDVLARRTELLADTIRPYVLAAVPARPTLLLDVLGFELRCLATGRLPTAAQLQTAIANDHWTIPPFDRAVGAPPFASRLLRVVRFMAWSAPDLLRAAAQGDSLDAFIDAIDAAQRLVPTYMVVTNIGYPLGGGESFMQHTCMILAEFGIRCIWLSFADQAGRPLAQPSYTHTPYYLDIRLSGAMTEAAVTDAIGQHAPDVVHAQGSANPLVERVCGALRVAAMIGQHFWHGLVDLGPTGAQDIMDNRALHRPVIRAPRPHGVLRYVASEFMRDVAADIGGGEADRVIHPVPASSHYRPRIAPDRRFVMQINLVHHKGGTIVRDCILALGQEIPFLVVESEPGDPGLFAAIRVAVAASPGSVYASYGEVADFYAQARLVLVPSLVDETFCRVAFEAVMAGVPVLCTTNGFLRQMFGDSGIFVDGNATRWIATIRALYHDRVALRKIARRQRARLTQQLGTYPRGFIDSFFAQLAISPRRSIGLLSVWGDQGLGNQVRHYAKLLRAAGWKVHVFSFQPYAAEGRALVRQASPADWAAPDHADTVHYSFNSREQVTAHEITQFVLVNHIGTLIYPEICWQTNWDRLFEISIPNLTICAVPNVETVLLREAGLHNRLTRTWFNTRLAQTALTATGVLNGFFIGHGFGIAPTAAARAGKLARTRGKRKIRFLHVAGHNPTTRKQTPAVLAAFRMALAERQDIELLVTCMHDDRSLLPTPMAGITVTIGTKPHADILQNYADYDVSIQVSSHEGLGLGFYESIAQGTPIISLDVAPHNEVVQHGLTGWLLPARYVPLPDNPDGIVQAAHFEPALLARLILRLTRAEITRVTASTFDTFSARFTETDLALRLIAGVP